MGWACRWVGEIKKVTRGCFILPLVCLPLQRRTQITVLEQGGGLRRRAVQCVQCFVNGGQGDTLPTRLSLLLNASCVDQSRKLPARFPLSFNTSSVAANSISLTHLHVRCTHGGMREDVDESKKITRALFGFPVFVRTVRQSPSTSVPSTPNATARKRRKISAQGKARGTCFESGGCSAASKDPRSADKQVWGERWVNVDTRC